MSDKARADARGLARRTSVAALDLACCVGIAACLWTAAARPAAAYVDPSVMTYTIQALAGVAVALSAVLGVVWRRARRWLLGVLRIDENAGKVVEPSVAAAPAGAGEAARAQAAREAASERSRQGKRPYQPLPWRRRILVALAPSLVLVATVLVVAPLEVVIAGSTSLSFNVTNVWQPLAVAALAGGLALALAVSVLRARAFDAALAVIAALSVGALAQEVALNSGLPSADGTPVVWANYAPHMALSVAVWVALIAAALVLARKRATALRLGSVAVALALALAQGTSLALLVQNHLADLSRPTVTCEGLMEVSPRRNVVMFILDTFDTQYMDEVLKRYPDVASELGGYTYYRNSVGSMIPTRYGVPALVTGQLPAKNSEPFTTEDLAGWFSGNNLLDVAASQGYSVGVYTDAANYGLDALAAKTCNVHEVAPYVADAAATVRTLGGCGLYRCLPWALKPHAWFTTDQLNQAVATTGGRDAAQTPYVAGDVSYYHALQAQGLAATDTAKAGAYRVIHLIGSHSPYIMNEQAEPCAPAQDAEAMYAQSAGSLKIVAEYVRQLKELGVYDNTTVIVTADHGVWPWNNTHLPKLTSPLLLVKPAGADTSVPLATSEVPTGHEDIPATLEQAFGAEASGTSITERTSEPHERHFWWCDHDGKIDRTLIEWAIEGDALNFNDWRETGLTKPPHVEGYDE